MSHPSRRWLFTVAATLAVACSTPPTPMDASDTPGDAAGCREGETRECSASWGRFDGPNLICDLGLETCRAGTWSACEGVREVRFDATTALIGRPESCSPCAPTCTVEEDTPDEADLCTEQAFLAGTCPRPNASGLEYSGRFGIHPAEVPIESPDEDSDMDGIPDYADDFDGPGAIPDPSMAVCPADCPMGTLCGNGTCDAGESAASCPRDCTSCGNSVCEAGETATGCPGDCTSRITCGNGVCDPSETGVSCARDCTRCGNWRCEPGETVATCGQDCGWCGDSVCTDYERSWCPWDCANFTVCGWGSCDAGEDATTCAADCRSGTCGDSICQEHERPWTCGDCSYTATCGDGICNYGEYRYYWLECLADCPTSRCGNGICDAGEEYSSCEADCMRFSARCFNGTCEAGENATRCSADCAVCGNGTCELSEQLGSCPTDCPTPCGNGICESSESATSCVADCTTAVPCGNGVCETSENPTRCAADCGMGLACGNGICEAGEESRAASPAFFHILPMGGPPVYDPLNISVQLRTADVYVLMDTTGSMGGEVDQLKTDLTRGNFLASNPSCGNGLLGAIRCMIPDAWFGVGNHDDFPIAPYGGGADAVLEHRSDIAESLTTAQAGVTAIDMGWGYDGPENNIQAMWVVATGAGIPGFIAPRTGCPAGRWGHACFRTGSIPIIINITDAPYHNGPPDPWTTWPYDSPAIGQAPGWNDVVQALGSRSMRVITVHTCEGLWSTRPIGGTPPSTDYDYCMQGERMAQALGNATGSYGSAGTPYVFRADWNGSGMTATIASAVEDLANYSRMDVSARPVGDTRHFTQSITATHFGPRGSCTGISGGTTFTQCLPGTDVNFDVSFANTMVPATSRPQVFNFNIEVIGNGTVILATVPVRIVVPPREVEYVPMGTYARGYDSTERCDPTNSCPDWAEFHYEGTMPEGTRIRFEIRASRVSLEDARTSSMMVEYEVPRALAEYNAAFDTYVLDEDLNIGELLDRRELNGFPYVDITAVLISSADLTRAPSLLRMSTEYVCNACR